MYRQSQQQRVHIDHPGWGDAEILNKHNSSFQDLSTSKTRTDLLKINSILHGKEQLPDQQYCGNNSHENCY
jgi:hypothetical protein